MKNNKSDIVIKPSFGKQMKQYGNLFLFYIPAIVLVIVFSYIPMAGIIMAFKKEPNLLGSANAIQGILDAKWVGFDHFKKIFSDPDILRALRNTLIISAQKIVILFPIPIVMAICINEMRGKVVKKSLQAVMYIPHFLSWITISGIFVTLLNYDTGIANNIMQFFGFDRIPFMTSNDTFRGVLVVSSAWAFLGWNTIVYVSAITALDRDLIEAAKIDGASKWQQIIHVTLPGIMPTIAVMFILRIGGIMDAGYDQVLAMYTPYIKESGDILGTYTFRVIKEAGLMPQYALGTAVGLFNSVVGLVLVLTGNFISRKLFKRGLW